MKNDLRPTRFDLLYGSGEIQGAASKEAKNHAITSFTIILKPAEIVRMAMFLSPVMEDPGDGYDAHDEGSRRRVHAFKHYNGEERRPYPCPDCPEHVRNFQAVATVHVDASLEVKQSPFNGTPGIGIFLAGSMRTVSSLVLPSVKELVTAVVLLLDASDKEDVAVAFKRLAVAAEPWRTYFYDLRKKG